MQSAIIYYSYSGNTRRVAQALGGILQARGPVDMIELEGLDESKSFFLQAARAFRRKRALINPVNFDLSRYDFICVGTPVWAFGPAPAVNTYMDRVAGLEGKDILIFTTYGSGAGKERCADYMREILSKKGAKSFKKVSVQQFKAGDKDFVASAIKSALAP
ncbi:MAG: NAD(P)H-dependent oxidoreductase [Candidatus Omnitrophota bacterium]